jgi:hypothetical protein
MEKASPPPRPLLYVIVILVPVLVMLVFYQFQLVWLVLLGPSVNGRPANVTTFSTDFSFQNLVFFWNLLDFQLQKSLKKSMSPTF